MSRIGKKPVSIPDGVTVNVDGNVVKVKGPKGELDFQFNDFLNVKVENNEVIVTPENKKDKNQKAFWGLTRKYIENLIVGVSSGFEKRLSIEGVGYRAQVQGNKLILNLGYSNPVEMDIPQDLNVQVNDNVKIVISGIDKYKVGQYAALVRKQRKPEPYKGKGVRYEGEHIKLKVGKSGV